MVSVALARTSPFEPLTIFARALAHLETRYVEPVDQKQLVYGALRGMLGALDPHTTFLDPEEYRILESDTGGRFAGIGVEVAVRDGWLTILSVFDGGPAAKQGLRPGDRFLEIEGKDARDMRINDAVRKMRGKAGTPVKVTVRRPGQVSTIAVTLKRATIDLDPVEAQLFSDGITYIRIKAFAETTAEAFSEVLDRVAVNARDRGGVRGVLLDLRDNGGGLLHQAVAVANEFIDKGTIVSTRGRDNVVRQSFKARRARTRPSWPIVVLINPQTASAAEIVAGALRDHGRAKIVGERSFGKGSVQNVIELPDGSAIKVTVARYFTPKGRSIQAQGIAPDVIVEGGASRPVVREESLPGHLPAVTAKATTAAQTVIPVEQGRVPVSFQGDPQARAGYRLLRSALK